MEFDLGKRMNQLRKSKGMTIEKLHERTGLAKASLSRWETNKSKPTLDALKRWAKGLQIDLDDIFFIELAADEIYLVKLFRDLDYSQKLHVFTTIKTFSNKNNE
ncbi:helix-turn-helix domain-containing protein [Paenibacillus sp. NRS-1783]|uniref:helix-turn-helix domain-containing protein n=1 Tax=Paenibacillus sp. NRS-1783 TaxID=3233907 RepID=UPI003D288B13